MYTETLTVGSFLVRIPSASSFFHQERVLRRTQQPELHRRAAPTGKVWGGKHGKTTLDSWKYVQEIGFWVSCSQTCAQSLWSWWSRGRGWASCAGWSGEWGGAFYLTYRAHNTPTNMKMEIINKVSPDSDSFYYMSLLLHEGQRSSLTVRPWGKSKRSCVWLGAAVEDWLWMELKSLGWWRPSCCSFSGFCVSVAENSSFCSGIWGGDRLRGQTGVKFKALPF